MLKYVKNIDPHRIFNACDPAYHPEFFKLNWQKPFWHHLNDNARKISQIHYVKVFNNSCNYYDKLEKSILKEGIHEPILTVAGQLSYRLKCNIPPWIDINKATICETLGGSRLMIAQKYDIPISMLVMDYKSLYDGKVLKTHDDVYKYCDKKYSTIMEMTNIKFRIIANKFIHTPGTDRDEVSLLRKKAVKETINIFMKQGYIII